MRVSSSSNRWPTLLLACVLFIHASLATPFAQPLTRNAIGSTTKPRDLTREIIQKRQTSAKQIMQRRNTRRRLEMVKRIDASCKPLREMAPSSKPYPTCPPAGGTIGYARYPQWDLYRDDLPGNPIYPADKQESSCITACNEFASSDDVCTGVVWSPSFCYLKGAKICDGYMTNTSPGSQVAGAALSLLGDCAKWSPYVLPEMDAVCCNS